MRQHLFVLLACLSSNAFASGGAGAQGQSMMSSLFMIGIFIVALYFMAIRPQTKRAKEHQQLISSIAKDDEVITQGGLLGKVLRVNEQFIVITIAEGIEVKIQKQAISATLPKGTMKTI